MSDLKNNEFIEFENVILNVGSILQVVSHGDWDWGEEVDGVRQKEDKFVVHFLGGGSLKFPQEKYESFKKLLIK